MSQVQLAPAPAPGRWVLAENDPRFAALAGVRHPLVPWPADWADGEGDADRTPLMKAQAVMIGTGALPLPVRPGPLYYYLLSGRPTPPVSLADAFRACADALRAEGPEFLRTITLAVTLEELESIAAQDTVDKAMVYRFEFLRAAASITDSAVRERVTPALLDVLSAAAHVYMGTADLAQPARGGRPVESAFDVIRLYYAVYWKWRNVAGPLLMGDQAFSTITHRLREGLDALEKEGNREADRLAAPVFNALQTGSADLARLREEVERAGFRQATRLIRLLEETILTFCMVDPAAVPHEPCTYEPANPLPNEVRNAFDILADYMENNTQPDPARPVLLEHWLNVTAAAANTQNVSEENNQ